MKTVEIVGYKRENSGTSDSRRLRKQGQVPCVLYGADQVVHFHAPMILFRELVYTDEAHFVKINVEGEEYDAIVHDIHFHPVSEIILHMDFLILEEKKPVKMDIPVRLEGTSPGVTKGGTLIHKRRNLKIKALPKNMPEYIEVDVSELDFGRSFKVGDLKTENFKILDTPIASMAVVETPRALVISEEEEELGEELEEIAAEGEEGEAPEGKKQEGEEKPEE